MPLSIRYKSILFMLVMGAASLLQAQDARMDWAEKLFERYAYSSAIDAYKSVLKKDGENFQAKLRLGDCYRMLNDYAEAAGWYASADNAGELSADYHLVFGMMLQAEGRCEEAAAHFGQYAEAHPEDSRGRDLAAACEEESAFRHDFAVFEIRNPEGLNTERTEIAPAYFGADLVFASSRRDGAVIQRRHTWNGEPFLDLFSVPFDTFNKGGFAEPKAIEAWNSKFHEGPTAFCDQTGEVFITRNSSEKGKRTRAADGSVKMQIFFTGKNAGELEPMPFSDPEYSDGHPTISQDGSTLIFASDRPGGSGGLDLWVSRRSGSAWSSPEPLGGMVNTPGDEAFPFLAASGKLYFASNGHPGLGGLDIQVTEQMDKSWSDVRNLGFPLNTGYDDFGLVWNGDQSQGLFASNREGGAGGDDIYIVDRIRSILAGEIIDAVTGKALDGVSLKFENRESSSDALGRFEFEISERKEMEVSASLEGYIGASGLAEETATGDLFVRFELHPGQKFEGVARNEEGTPLAGTMLTLMDDLGNIVAETEAADDGSFSFEVLGAAPDGDYTVVAEKSGFSPNRTLTASSKEVEVVMEKAPDCSIFKPVYFDQNRHDIRRSEVQKLESVLAVMQEHPDLVVELASHTDSRWSHAYNDKLSAKRTYSVARWLWDNGIEKERLVDSAFGENRLTNDCGDGVPCDETQHQANRRTEFHCVLPDYKK